LELLNDNPDALKEREDEIDDLRQRMEELSAVGQAVDEEIVGSKKIWTVKWWLAQNERRRWRSLGGAREEGVRDVEGGTLSYNRKSLHCWRLSTNLRRCDSVQRRQRLP